MTTRQTRRVRAGTPPPDSTGCLPVDYTAQQIDAWAREQDQERRPSRKTLLLSLATTAALPTTLAVTVWGAISK